MRSEPLISTLAWSEPFRSSVYRPKWDQLHQNITPLQPRSTTHTQKNPYATDLLRPVLYPQRPPPFACSLRLRHLVDCLGLLAVVLGHRGPRWRGRDGGREKGNGSDRWRGGDDGAAISCAPEIRLGEGSNFGGVAREAGFFEQEREAGLW